MAQESIGNEVIAESIASITHLVRDLEQKKLKFGLVAKYTKIEYEALCKDNAVLRERIASMERSISRTETKLPASVELMQSLMKSSTVAKNVTDNLVHYRSHVLQSEAMWKKKYEQNIADYEKEYELMKKSMEDDSELYKKYQIERNEEKSLEIQNRMVLKKIEEHEKKIALQKKINHKLFNAQFVSFAKAMTTYKRNEESAEKKAIIADLIKKLNQGLSSVTQPTVQYTRANPFDQILSRSKDTSVWSNFKSMPETTNHVDTATQDDRQKIQLLNELKKKMTKGSKNPLERTDSNSSLRSVTQSRPFLKRTTTVQANENSNAKKVRILQDVNVTDAVVKPSNPVSDGEPQNKVQKRVSFAMPQQKVATNKATDENVPISRQNSFNERNKDSFFKSNVGTLSARQETGQRNFLVPRRQDLKRSMQGQEKMDESIIVENFLDSSGMDHGRGFLSSDFSANFVESDLDVSQQGLNESALGGFEREEEAGIDGFNYFNFGGDSQQSTSSQFFF